MIHELTHIDFHFDTYKMITETEEQKRILLYEDRAAIDVVQQQVERDLIRLRAVADAYQEIGVFPELTDLNVLSRYGGKKPREIEKEIRNFLVEQTGTNLNGVSLDAEQVAAMIKLPEATGGFVKAIAVAFSTLSFDLANFQLKEGKVVVNETEVEAKKAQYRKYAQSEAHFERLQDFEELAEHVNRLAKKYGESHFQDKEIPFLEGGFYPRRSKDGLTTNGYHGSYKPSWRAVLGIGKSPKVSLNPFQQ